MKNCENPEMQKRIAAAIFASDCPNCPLDEIGNGIDCVDNCEASIIKWMNQEYVEPHKWEPWELQAMQHTTKDVLKIGRTRKDGGILNCRRNGAAEGSTIDFPSIKIGEVFDIDYELLRNGMSR